MEPPTTDEKTLENEPNDTKPPEITDDAVVSVDPELPLDNDNVSISSTQSNRLGTLSAVCCLPCSSAILLPGAWAACVIGEIYTGDEMTSAKQCEQICCGYICPIPCLVIGIVLAVILWPFWALFLLIVLLIVNPVRKCMGKRKLFRDLGV